MKLLSNLKTAVAALIVATGLAGNPASAATYNPVGVQNDVAVADVLSGGWSVIYSGLYDQHISIADAFAGAGDMVMLAARRVGSNTFDLLASIETAVYLPLQTALNATIDANGARWYKNGYSLGFAGATDTITQSTADTNGYAERDRLSWHTNWIGYAPGQNSADPAVWLSPGWRSGDNTSLNYSTDWERFVLTANVAAVPLPAGGLLLIGAMGGLAALRRRKRVA